MDDIGPDVLHSPPARQPEPIAARLKGDRGSGDLAPSLDRLVAATMKQLEKSVFAGGELLQRGSLDPRHDPGTIPATSQLDRLISRTAISVLFCSKAMPDRLRSFGFGMGRSIGW
ncbi:MAG: hypothetical protein M3Z96_13645 [Pseudomonadota bacterium]|nr:hypothetical protein [Pseudomonadota bacterium]